MVSSWLPLTLATISHRKWKKKTDVLNKWSWGLILVRSFGHFMTHCNNRKVRCQALPGPEWVWTLPAHLGCSRTPTRGVTQKKQCWWPSWEQTYNTYLHTLEDDFPFPKCSFPGGYFVLRQRVRRPEQASSFTLLDCSGKVGKWMAWSLLMFMALGQDPLLCRMLILALLLCTFVVSPKKLHGP